MSDAPIRIKRYPNRRFYASHSSSYVSLPEIEEFVRSGMDVEIVDSQTGEDLTRAVLMQVIAERHPEKMAMFPAAMLHAMLRANDVVSGFLQDYFRNALSYLDYLHRHGTTSPLQQPMHWMKAWLDQWSRSSDAGSQSPKPPTPPDDASEDYAARLRQLEERISQLERERTPDA
jgi:polyhydroxyalkanoate synthesis repressor PhaR